MDILVETQCVNKTSNIATMRKSSRLLFRASLFFFLFLAFELMFILQCKGLYFIVVHIIEFIVNINPQIKVKRNITGIHPPYTREPSPGFPMHCRNPTRKQPIRGALYSGGMYRLNVVQNIFRKNISKRIIPAYPKEIDALINELCPLIAPSFFVYSKQGSPAKNHNLPVCLTVRLQPHTLFCHDLLSHELKWIVCQKTRCL